MQKKSLKASIISLLEEKHQDLIKQSQTYFANPTENLMKMYWSPSTDAQFLLVAANTTSMSVSIYVKKTAKNLLPGITESLKITLFIKAHKASQVFLSFKGHK